MLLLWIPENLRDLLSLFLYLPLLVDSTVLCRLGVMCVLLLGRGCRIDEGVFRAFNTD